MGRLSGCYSPHGKGRSQSVRGDSMSKAPINLKCDNCGTEFIRTKAEHNRCIKRGLEKAYCSFSCCGKAGRKMKKKNDKPRMTREEHKTYHVELHSALDQLLADFMRHTGKPALERPISDLMVWAYQQTQNPTEIIT